ncbi:MAG: flagellar hook-basal body complex protein [Oscillospiraceae bacterium]|nr:flagellar hook-basal body complex protein [Oscillospiraceae bacterium]
MVRSLYSGVSGLNAHQTKMDVIGNNIANVNTYGFKAGRASFSDVFYQSIKNAAAGTVTFAGNNPSTVGYGVQVASIDKDMSQSSFQSTNRTLDLAISGDGFFAIGKFSTNKDGSMPTGMTPPDSIAYTRNGNFGIDSEGNLVSNNNYFVLGCRNNTEGLLATGDVSSKTLLTVEMGDNNADNLTNSADYVYGNTLNINNLIKTAYNIFTGDNGVLYTYQTYEIDEDGALVAEDPVLCNIKGEPILEGAEDGEEAGEPIEYDPDMSTAEALEAGGIVGEFTFADLSAFTIGSDGVITVTYNNQLKAIGRIEVTVFDNPEGLIEVGETCFAETAASGVGKVKKAGDQGAGKIASNKLEMSNVNLAQEFSDMIVTQRGFQANARIITTSDSMLEELVNLKR